MKGVNNVPIPPQNVYYKAGLYLDEFMGFQLNEKTPQFVKLVMMA